MNSGYSCLSFLIRPYSCIFSCLFVSIPILSGIRVYFYAVVSILVSILLVFLSIRVYVYIVSILLRVYSQKHQYLRCAGGQKIDTNRNRR